MIRIRCLHSISEADEFRTRVNALNAASARPDPFSTYEYYKRFLRNAALFPPDQNLRLWLLLALEGEELVGYLALKQHSDRVLGLPAVKLDFLTAHIASRPHAVARRGHEQAIGAAFYAYVLGRKKEWSLLEFHQQDADSVLLPPPADAASGSFQVHHWPTMANGTIGIRWASLDGYFAALSKKFRSNLSRQMRTLMASGEVQMLTSSDPDTTPTLFDLYRSIEAHSWKDHTGAAISGNAKWLDYFAGLMEPDQRMQLVIQVLLLNGIPVAGLICGCFGKGLYALHIVYDGRLARLGPGSAILLMGMRTAIEGGYEFFDLLSGFGYYKLRWLAHMRETQSLQIYRVGTPYFWRRELGDAKRRWFGKLTADDSSLSNPGRPAHDPDKSQEEPDGYSGWAAADESQRYAGLIARVRKGHGEFLTSAQLAGVMPFETQRRIAPRSRSGSDQHRGESRVPGQAAEALGTPCA